jgi:hypothetical protein
MRRSSKNEPRPIDLNVHGPLVENRLDAAIELLRDGKVSIPEFGILTAALERTAKVYDAQRFREQLQQLEASRIATLETLRSLAPARKRIVDVSPESSEQ